MMSQPAMGLLEQLAAEGVSPWLVVAGGGEFPPDSAAPAVVHGAVAARVDLGAVRAACDALWETFRQSEGRRGRVSVPVDPRLVYDAEALVDAARAVHGEVGRSNLLVRIPATRAGVVALERCLALGISVDADLIFSAERYGQVLGAALAGLEGALAAGLRLQQVAAVTSVPVGVLDAEVNSRLMALPRQRTAAAGVQDTAAVAVARQMYRVREQRLDGEWWRVLRAAGAAPPQLMWTEVGPRHVGALVGWNTAQAVSLEVLEAAAAQHQLRGDTLLNGHTEARRALETLDGLGIRMADVVRELEAVELGRLQDEWAALRP
ncbi:MULTISPECIES: transaldolase family protein [unclassified Streptomyces]|uniref:transaldolase family protein n=1 Tax=unclassified Streptomyces TaxID=2593676 RepID=UPI001BE51D67|nr:MULTISPECIES: transaldolase family protein [unclassified Streptomyces]MBT2407559.1 hypothetical protein [Streptomyces sp. ISL-21]MBT2457679.1 hypothetical protein [Streptomyces sp. ISL-86]MBT2606882.1 hypothetical protein [Streptomyces sp. ISL-87]